MGWGFLEDAEAIAASRENFVNLLFLTNPNVLLGC